MGLGSVDLIPLEQNYLQEGKAEVFPAGLCWAQPCLCHRSVTVQVLQGLPGHCRALRGSSVAWLSPAAGFALWLPSVSFWPNKSSATPAQCSHFSLNPLPLSCHHRPWFRVSLHLPSKPHQCQGLLKSPFQTQP